MEGAVHDYNAALAGVVAGNLDGVLNEVTPGDHPKKTALFNSGAEAVENAVKIARNYPLTNISPCSPFLGP